MPKEYRTAYAVRRAESGRHVPDAVGADVFTLPAMCKEDQRAMAMLLSSIPVAYKRDLVISMRWTRKMAFSIVVPVLRSRYMVSLGRWYGT